MSGIGELHVQPYVLRFQCVNFVESGCYHGAGLKWGKANNFKKLYSCDIIKDHINKAQSVVEKDIRVELYYGPSHEYFAKLLPTLKGVTFFWLDAHCPKHYDPKLKETPLTHFPLYKELQLIVELKEHYERDVIICDDVRTIVGEDNTAPLAQGRVKDYYSVEWFTYTQMTSLFTKTHRLEIPNQSRDAIAFIPGKEVSEW